MNSEPIIYNRYSPAKLPNMDREIAAARNAKRTKIASRFFEIHHPLIAMWLDRIRQRPNGVPMTVKQARALFPYKTCNPKKNPLVRRARIRHFIEGGEK